MSGFTEARGFRGWRFHPESARHTIQDLLCPPYDVISPQEQRLYEAKSPSNAVHLILPEAQIRQAGGSEGYDYAVQARKFQEMQDRGILQCEPSPSIYVVHQTFTHPETGKNLTRRGVIGLRRLSEFSEQKVLPHEKTLSGPKSDRLRLLKALRANLCPIFCLYEDRSATLDGNLEKFVSRKSPLYEADLFDETKIRFWVVDDPKAMACFQEILSKPITIADGHHRYETALNYAREVNAKGQGAKDAHQYLMVFFVSFADPGLFILPTHRMMKGLEKFDASNLIQHLTRRFSVRPLADFEATHARVAGLLSGAEMKFIVSLAQEVHGDRHFLIIVPKHLIGKDQVGALDVSVLHTEILEKTLGMNAQSFETQKFLQYTRDPGFAEAEVKSGRMQAAWFMKPPSVDQVRKVCASKRLMPQKSTYFFPKIPTGLVFYKH